MNSDPNAELVDLTRAISQASKHRNRATLEKLMADGFVLTLASGRTYTKAEMISQWTADYPGLTDESFEIHEPLVYAFGDLAIVTAVITDAWRDSEGYHVVHERIFDVWQRQVDGWLWVAAKPTRVTH